VDGGVRHFEFLYQCIFNVIDTFLIEVPMFPLSLVKIGQIVYKWQQLFEIQDGGGRHLELWLRIFFRRHRADLNQSSNIPTKFGDDWSNSREIATVFLNSRWWRPLS